MGTIIVPWKESYDKPRQHIKEQSHYFADKGLYSQSYGASLVAQLVKICLQCGRPGFNPWVGKIPWRKERLSTLVFWPGEFLGVAKNQTWLNDFHKGYR